MPRLTRRPKDPKLSKFARRRKRRKSLSRKEELTPRELQAKKAAGEHRRNEARKKRIAQWKAHDAPRPRPVATNDTPNPGSVPNNVQELG